MKLVAVAVLATVWISGALLAGGAGSSDLDVFRPGVIISRARPLSAQELGVLLAGLRRWTGFQDMRFDDEGVLRTGDRGQVAGGSPSARALLTAAVDGIDSFLLENHDQSSDVAFAAIRATACYVDGKDIEHQVWSVKLDFRDFARLRGSGESLLAFDPAINILHELGHGVLGLRDSVDEDDPLGECERHINRIRREVGLPERRSYEPDKQLAATPFRTEQRLVAELVFVNAPSERKTGKSFLIFDVEDVVQRRGSRILK